MSITLFIVNSTIEYDPNLALCPGLSALPSPPIISWLLIPSVAFADVSPK